MGECGWLQFRLYPSAVMARLSCSLWWSGATAIALLTRLLHSLLTTLPYCPVMHCVQREVREWTGDLTAGEWAER